jgi:hypothetical protein
MVAGKFSWVHIGLKRLPTVWVSGRGEEGAADWGGEFVSGPHRYWEQGLDAPVTAGAATATHDVTELQVFRIH